MPVNFFFFFIHLLRPRNPFLSSCSGYLSCHFNYSFHCSCLVQLISKVIWRPTLTDGIFISFLATGAHIRTTHTRTTVKTHAYVHDRTHTSRRAHACSSTHARAEPRTRTHAQKDTYAHKSETLTRSSPVIIASCQRGKY